MGTARRLSERSGGVYIIFLTSHAQYMREAFKEAFAEYIRKYASYV